MVLNCLHTPHAVHAQSEPASGTPLYILLDSIPKRGGRRGNKNTKSLCLSTVDDMPDQPKPSRAEKKKQQCIRMQGMKKKENWLKRKLQERCVFRTSRVLSNSSPNILSMVDMVLSLWVTLCWPV